MKKITLILAHLTLFISATIAQKSGTIIYEEKMKLSFNFGGEASSALKSSMPSERTLAYILKYNEDASIYEYLARESQNESQEIRSGNAVIKMEFAQPQNIFYNNIKEKSSTNKQELMGKNFLINRNFSDLKWKIEDEFKKIGDYHCQKAILSDSIKTIAWFTPQIPISIGPSKFSNLPGMILEVEIDEGKRVITAVEFSDEAITDIQEPKGGKKVTEEEFETMSEEKMKEMQKQFKGKDGAHIIIERN